MVTVSAENIPYLSVPWLFLEIRLEHRFKKIVAHVTDCLGDDWAMAGSGASPKLSVLGKSVGV